MKNNLMIDLETLSLHPDAHILSIGAVWFDIDTGELGDELHIVTNPDVTNGRIDAGTVAWWARQSKAARQAVFEPTHESVTLAGALRCLNAEIDHYFETGCRGMGVSPVLWSRGYMDPAWLESAYMREKIEPMFTHGWWRDQRTVVDMVGLDHTDFVNAVQHNALDDCKVQIVNLVAALQMVKRVDDYE